MEQFDTDIGDWKNFLSFIDECTDEYVYIYDLSNDYAIYSKRVTETFALDTEEFANAGMRLKDVAYSRISRHHHAIAFVVERRL